MSDAVLWNYRLPERIAHISQPLSTGIVDDCRSVQTFTLPSVGSGSIGFYNFLIEQELRAGSYVFLSENFDTPQELPVYTSEFVFIEDTKTQYIAGTQQDSFLLFDKESGQPQSFFPVYLFDTLSKEEFSLGKTDMYGFVSIDQIDQVRWKKGEIVLYGVNADHFSFIHPDTQLDLSQEIIGLEEASVVLLLFDRTMYTKEDTVNFIVVDPSRFTQTGTASLVYMVGDQTGSIVFQDNIFASGSFVFDDDF
ncbi:MAG: hypothetical protein U9Q15_03900, partial [Patescibacteria group bacterium]|nr:hypothetical protein [Patescibacteria group bacterium]